MSLHEQDFVQAFQKLGIPREAPVLAHASLSAFPGAEEGAATLVGALLHEYRTVVMPAFTYQTMLIPETGPQGNGITYGSGRDLNRMAVFFAPDLPADRMMGEVAEALRTHPGASRSDHPILSFAGVGAEQILAAQPPGSPLTPIGKMLEMEGWVLLLGVNQTVNTTLHYAEQRAGRKQFIRWALTRYGVEECRNFPGCSDGFEAIAPYIEMVTRRALVGEGRIQAVPMKELVERACQYIQADPLGLLCSRPDCERCNAVREAVGKR